MPSPHETDRSALVPIGWDERVATLFGAARPGEPGRIARVDRGLFTVLVTEGERRVALSPSLRGSREMSDRATVGDWVVVVDDVIEQVLPRRSAFVRGDPGKPTAAQVVAANVDTVFAVHGLTKPVNVRRIERELVLVWESGAVPVVVLSKLDLCDDPEAARRAAEEVARGVDVHLVSGVTGEGIEGLRAYAGGNRTVALVGASGVGKSTLANRLLGEELLATQEVRAGDQRGRHTTTVRQLVVLPGGGVLVDTPGLRALALWDASEGLGETFADVEELEAQCRFSDCGHSGEPGCAIVAAIDAGTLSPDRLASYLALQEELAQLDEARAAEEKLRRKREERIMSRVIRAAPKRP